MTLCEFFGGVEKKATGYRHGHSDEMDDALLAEHDVAVGEGDVEIPFVDEGCQVGWGIYCR